MIVNKISQPKAHLSSDDLTPQEKEILFTLMQKYGASRGFAYDRFFKEGFSLWELEGVDQIKRRFLSEHKKEIFPSEVKAKTADIVDGKGVFYRTLGLHVGMKKLFTEFMANLGMGANSVLNKFSTDDWKAYEVVGVLRIAELFEMKLSQRKEAVTA